MQRLAARVFLAQLGQHGGDVFGEHGAGGEDQHAVGAQRVPAAVQQIGRAVHGHAGLARTGAAHDGHHLRVLEADGAVLLLLDRVDDAVHVARHVLGQDVQQQAVVDAERGVHIVDQPPVFHAVLTLQCHLAGDHALRTAIAARARQGVVIQPRHGGAPVVHQNIAAYILQRVQPDHDLFHLRLAVLPEVHAGEERIEQHLAAAARLIVGQRLARQIAIDLQPQRFHLLRGYVGGLEPQLVPGVGQQLIDVAHAVVGKSLGFLDHRP